MGLKPVRRIVTTHDQNGKAVVLFDGAPPDVLVRPDTGIVRWPIWVTQSTPADTQSKDDKALLMKGLIPPAGGAVCRVIDFPPIAKDVETQDPNFLARALGIAEESSQGHASRHPLMHRTRSIDYAFIIEGEIDMLLDDSEVHLTVGDVVVQQATNHAWVNRGSAICRIAFVLIDAIGAIDPAH